MTTSTQRTRETEVGRLRELADALNLAEREGVAATLLDADDTTKVPWVRLSNGDAVWYSLNSGFQWGHSFQHTAKSPEEAVGRILRGQHTDAPKEA